MFFSLDYSVSIQFLQSNPQTPYFSKAILYFLSSYHIPFSFRIISFEIIICFYQFFHYNERQLKYKIFVNYYLSGKKDF